MPATGFQKLHCIVSVPYEVTTKGNLSIGTGKGDGLRDNLIIREGGPESGPVISGSSVKGMARSTIEGILAEAEPGHICVPFVCLGRDRNLPEGRKEDCGRSSRDNPCPVCQMFGNTEMSGRVSFRDAHLAGDLPETYERTHVALRRDTKTAAGGALVTIETLPPGVKFRGEVVLTNPDDWMVGAVIHVLELLPAVGLGAKKTSGYGEVEVEVFQAEYKLPPRDKAVKDNQSFYRAWLKLAKLA
jgi:CRISPR-associated RAMP protein (TIGR02581 family)